MLRLFLKNWILLFIIIVSSLIIGVRTSAVFFRFFFWFLMSLITLSLVWVIAEYLGVKLYLKRSTVTKIEEDDVLEIETLVKNKSFLPVFNLVLEDNISCADFKQRKRSLLIEFLGIRSYSNIKYNCLCPLRGKYDIGPFVVYFFDPFGIFFLKKTYHIYSQLYVYQRTFNIKSFPDLIKGILPWFGIGTSRISGDDDEFFGTREYKEGDPIKRIHWISTARKNRFIVKQFQRQSFFRATIIFNLEKDKNFGEGKEKVVEYIIRIAASIAKYLIEKDISVEVIAHTGEIVHIPFNKGPEHLEDIFKFLATARAESMISLGEIFEEFSRHIPNNSSLIVIMLDTDQKYLPSLLLLQKRNISVTPLIVISPTFLDAFDKQGILKNIETKILPTGNLNPLFISQGDNLEESFLKY